jgi:hypothetical protein
MPLAARSSASKTATNISFITGLPQQFLAAGDIRDHDRDLQAIPLHRQKYLAANSGLLELGGQIRYEETTETLYLLGEQHRIVGISGYTVRPPQARDQNDLLLGDQNDLSV